ncbi:hypothetical protein D1AOALGA4SA_8133 [Olavius algarvensis Delta 1 endosymbiont]|nr:hypothetical protein D1AOALGA4SA_8133 [Olavius algarvensis Delta 1 endosymbiont]
MSTFIYCRFQCPGKNPCLKYVVLNIEWTHKRKNSHYISMIR